MVKELKKYILVIQNNSYLLLLILVLFCFAFQFRSRLWPFSVTFEPFFCCIVWSVRSWIKDIILILEVWKRIFWREETSTKIIKALLQIIDITSGQSYWLLPSASCPAPSSTMTHRPGKRLSAQMRRKSSEQNYATTL